MVYAITAAGNPRVGAVDQAQSCEPAPLPGREETPAGQEWTGGQAARVCAQV
ncbi:hypothetical protein [Kitasatospora mediocidica]|uniref:hypothetical protein n=1 Tax=Kitasatospora mediocidica TaxID=58352 RepID=UPI000AD32A98|nr:hypothetical protein [Kitasatospora mediocidica]